MKKLLILLALFISTASFGQLPCRYFSGQTVRCKDGDTDVTLVDLGFNVKVEIIVRLASINAPEMKGKDSLAARASKAHLEELILGKTVYFDTKEKLDIFGRYIETIYLSPTDSISVNQMMVMDGYAKAVKY